jgi:PAS domain S-box-containing protein
MPGKQRAADATDATDWRALFERSGCVMLLEDDSWTIVHANDAACRILRRSREELEGTRIDDLVIWPTPGKLAEERRELRRGTTLVVRRRLKAGDGEIVDLDLCGSAAALPGRTFFVGLPPTGTRELKPEQRGKPLTPREQEVVDLLAEGLTGEEAAQHLTLSPDTVRTHIRNAMDKLGAHTRAHLVAMRMHDLFSR